MYHTAAPSVTRRPGPLAVFGPCIGECMNLPRFGLGALLLLPTVSLRAQEAPPFPREPMLQLQSVGPTAAVNGLAFAPDGKTLYAAGYDKVVRAWRHDGKQFAPHATYRVPAGPGPAGAINALAVSPDGRWVAAAGYSLMREAPGFRQTGFVMPRAGRLSPEMLEDQGTIHLFDTTGKGAVTALRGHRGPVLSLTFVPARPGQPSRLVSFAREARGASHVGRVRLWSLVEGEELAGAEVGRGKDPGDGRPRLAA